MLKKLGITSIYSNKVRNITLASVALGTSAYVLSSDNEFRHKLFADALPVTTRIFDYWHGERKRVLFKGLTNETVLQLAPSCGPNFKYFPPSVAFKAVEPSSQAIDVLADQAEELGFPKGVIDITHANVFEHLQSLGDESENSIVCTHTLSTVDNHKEVCKEIYRVLKPGGKFYFIEYTQRSPYSIMGLIQNIYNPFRKVVANGTSINHSIAESIFSSGFSASNSYMEYWPNTTDDANPRRGIKLVRYDEESKTLKGVGGVKAIVAGIAVKKYKETKIQPFYFSYKGERK